MPGPMPEMQLAWSLCPDRAFWSTAQTGKTRNLLSKAGFQDVEAHFEFLVPKGANSGVKFESLYEIQIFDSFGVANADRHAIAGASIRGPRCCRYYHHIDKGIPPRVNAARPFGEWQTLDVVFRAPRIDSAGKKVRNARFDKVILNGQVIHENVELKSPTGHAWRRGDRTRPDPVARRPRARGVSQYPAEAARLGLLLLPLLLPVAGLGVQLDAGHPGTGLHPRSHRPWGLGVRPVAPIQRARARSARP